MDIGSNGYPDQAAILAEGATIRRSDGDGIHPVEFRWEWDPPLMLPHRGNFGFYIMRDCVNGGGDFLANNTPDGYPGGVFYLARGGCQMGPQYDTETIQYPQYDVTFQIGLCHDAATPARRASWGRLKMLYR